VDKRDHFYQFQDFTMPFLTQHQYTGPQTSSNTNVPVSVYHRGYARQVEESWLNLSQLALYPYIDRKELIFGLDTAGELVSEEIYWLQIETLCNNQVLWRGEVGVFYDETMPNVRFLGSIPLPEFQLRSQEQSNLYDLHLTLFRGTKLLDRVEIYFELHKCVSENGPVYTLNNYCLEQVVEPAKKLEIA
jgi:hypothetical protein